MIDGKVITIYLLMLKPKRVQEIICNMPDVRDAITNGRIDAAQRFGCGFFPWEISDSLLLNQLVYKLLEGE